MRLRHLVGYFIVTLAVPALALAESPTGRINYIRVGFNPNNDKDRPIISKPGMWTPVFVDVMSSVPLQVGNGLLPENQGRIEIRCPDSDDVGVVYTTNAKADAGQNVTLYSCVKPGHFGSKAIVDFHIGFPDSVVDSRQIDLDRGTSFDTQIFLSLGGKIAELDDAFDDLLTTKQKNQADTSLTQARVAVYESEVKYLPQDWRGYDSVDLIFLLTDDRKFLTDLGERFGPLRDWVRRGGRLVISVSRANQDLIHELLSDFEMIDRGPPLPVAPPADPGSAQDFSIKRLLGVERWSRVANKAFPNDGDPPVVLSRLAPGGVTPGLCEVLAEESERGRGEDKVPSIVRMPYGRGQVTLLAFSFADPAFKAWRGKVDFLKSIILRLAPRAPSHQAEASDLQIENTTARDVSSELQRSLDVFDVPVVSFGYVAFFMLLAILIIGPLDYLFLKHVLKRLEWSWITFPLLIAGISIAAGYLVNSVKGTELIVNKIDIVDFDLRSAMDESFISRQAIAQGHSFFSIYSPTNQTYDVRFVNNARFWGKPTGPDEISTFGRPDFEAFGIGRPGSQGLAQNAYEYAPFGLKGVSIPIWAIKTFAATWETSSRELPMIADLSYHQKPERGREVKITGNIKNSLPADLVDLWIFYADRCYSVDGQMEPGETRQISLQTGRALDTVSWAQFDNAKSVSGNTFDPIVKQILFHERVDIANRVPNYQLRRLDLSWRLQEEPRAQGLDAGVREAILFAKVKYPKHDNSGGEQNPLNGPPSILAVEAPGQHSEETSPLTYDLHQETYIRVIIPVRPFGG